MKRNTRLALIITLVILALAVAVGVFLQQQLFPEHKVRGLTKAEWLVRLSPIPPQKDAPLQIVNISKEAKPEVVAVEVALSYDSLMQNDFWEGGNFIKLKVESEISGYMQFYRSASSNCVLQLAPDKLHWGTNRIQAVLWITDPADKDHYFEIVGPPITYVFTPFPSP